MIIVNNEYKTYQVALAKIEEQLNKSPIEKINVLNEKQEEYKKRLMKYSIGVSGLALFMFLSVIGISRVVSTLVEKELESFILFFKKASDNLEHINKEEFYFYEFKTLADSANYMVENIKKKNDDLIQLNNTLEDQVKQKTQKLAIKNNELLESNQRVENLLKAQDEFIKKSIHEINTPISIILTNIELYRIKNGTNKHIKNVESGAKTIHNIFNDLSYLIKKDRIEYKKTDINFSQFLKYRVDFFYEVASANGLFFNLKIDEDVMVFYNDTELQRIIDNNISNAIKYSYNDSVIEISLKQNQKAFIIQTNSKKIENTERIFTQYYRENDARGGFGIGLNIVKEICDKNNTKINIISNEKFTQFEYIFS